MIEKVSINTFTDSVYDSGENGILLIQKNDNSFFDNADIEFILGSSDFHRVGFGSYSFEIPSGENELNELLSNITFNLNDWNENIREKNEESAETSNIDYDFSFVIQDIKYPKHKPSVSIERLLESEVFAFKTDSSYLHKNFVNFRLFDSLKKFFPSAYFVDNQGLIYLPYSLEEFKPFFESNDHFDFSFEDFTFMNYGKFLNNKWFCADIDLFVSPNIGFGSSDVILFSKNSSIGTTNFVYRVTIDIETDEPVIALKELSTGDYENEGVSETLD